MILSPISFVISTSLWLVCLILDSHALLATHVALACLLHCLSHPLAASWRFLPLTMPPHTRTAPTSVGDVGFRPLRRVASPFWMTTATPHTHTLPLWVYTGALLILCLARLPLQHISHRALEFSPSVELSSLSSLSHSLSLCSLFSHTPLSHRRFLSLFYFSLSS